MMEEDDGAPSGRSSPPTPKKVKMQSDEPKELLKAEDQIEDESKENDDGDGEEDEDEDGSPPGWQQSPLLLDMIDLPPSSPLPPTPPLPSSPRDLNMEQQDSEDEGPPPGWDNTYQLKEQVEQMLTPANLSAISSDVKVEEQDSEEDEGPPPGWDIKCQTEPELQTACPTITQSDIKVEEQDSEEEDEGPPPGWDAKCHPEPELQVASSTITQSDLSDIKSEDVEQDARHGQHPSPNPAPQLLPSDIKMEEQESEDEGPPPGWDIKCPPKPELLLQTPSPTITQSDVKTDDIQQDDPQLLLVPSDIKVEEHEVEGPPPGWDSKCQPGSQLQTPSNPRTPPSHSKIEDDDQQQEEDEEGPPPGWEQQHHSNLPSPSGARMDMECEQKRPQPPSRQQSISPIKPQIPLLKPPSTTNNPEMGQMVCGSCRRLLSYPKGARYVECGCCLEENYVLEEHEVGQVICGGCDVLLMYPYGAPKVRCVNCSTETEIIDQNRRPPLSEQQRRARRHLKRAQPGNF